jgi:NaMN:DMB phosphoribosyltransferase
VRLSWPASFAVGGFALVAVSVLLEATLAAAAAPVLLDGGIALATLGVALQIIGTLRTGQV